MVTSSGEAAQTRAFATSKRGLGREAQAALLRVRTGPECPEGNLKELTWDSKPDYGIATPQKALTSNTARPTHRTKDWTELASCGPAHPPPETGRRGQPEPEGGTRGPREASSTKLQAGFVANQDFLGFWTVDICLRRCASCTPRKPSGRDGGGDKSQWLCSTNTWSPVRKHLTGGFLCAVLDLSGILCSLLIPEYSGIKRRGKPLPGLRNPGISFISVSIWW